MSRRPGRGSKSLNSAVEPPNQKPDNWDNPQIDCPLCRMEKRTEWYYENKYFVVAEKLGGGPFVVLKEHKEELDDGEEELMHKAIRQVFDEPYETRVLMNMVPDHYHAHIITQEDVDLSDE